MARPALRDCEEFENLPAGMPEDDAFFAHRPTPYLITRWVYEVAQHYGTHSSYWQAHVRGEFFVVLGALPDAGWSRFQHGATHRGGALVSVTDHHHGYSSAATTYTTGC